MEKLPEMRYESFEEVKKAIGKYDFINMEISQEDKNTYQAFADLVFKALKSFTHEQKFNHDVNVFIATLENALRDNLFEDYIQNNADVISSVVIGGYKYDDTVGISCSVVVNFLNWFKSSTPESQKLILNNIITKLSNIKIIEKELDVPF